MFKKLGTGALAAVRKLREERARESAIQILGNQVLEFRGSAWIAGVLHIVETDGGVHLRLHWPDGRVRNELVLDNGDRHIQAIRLKMTMAVSRFTRRAA